MTSHNTENKLKKKKPKCCYMMSMHVWKYQEISDLVLEIIWKQIQMKTQKHNTVKNMTNPLFSLPARWHGSLPPTPKSQQRSYDIITPRDGLPVCLLPILLQPVTTQHDGTWSEKHSRPFSFHRHNVGEKMHSSVCCWKCRCEFWQVSAL